ncbi:MAG: glycine betaine/L-proline ABC transporter substrate-binding protein ProX [Burkholderiaceae bacterium]
MTESTQSKKSPTSTQGTIRKLRRHLALRIGSTFVLVGFALTGLPALAAPAGVVQPGVSTDEELFQTLVVMHALKDIGFRVRRQVSATYEELHNAVAAGRATFIANHWSNLHRPYLTQPAAMAGLAVAGRLVDETRQGYLVDRRTASKLGLKTIADLKDPAKAALFDTNGDGKADLVGCEQSWSCAAVIDHQLKAFDLANRIEQTQKGYNQQMQSTLKRLHSREPVLFYAWEPGWVTGQPDIHNQVRWLAVPFSALPPPRSDLDSAGPDGINTGFQTNSIQIIANTKFLNNHPAAARLLGEINIPARDISEQNMRMQIGEDSIPDIERHARQWIAANRNKYDRWLAVSKGN